MKEKLLEKINNNPKIIRYKELEKIISADDTLISKMDELKSIQKEIVHAEKIGKIEMAKSLKDKYNDLLEHIEDYPLMEEYLELQSEINEILQNFKEVIETAINGDL